MEAGRNRSNLQPPTSNIQNGFSLVELLIAAVIIALTASLLVGGLISANRSAALRAQQAVSTELLATQLAALPDALPPDAPAQAACPEPLTGDTSCTMELAGGPLPSLRQVTLTLTHQGHAAHVATLRQVQEPQS